VCLLYKLYKLNKYYYSLLNVFCKFYSLAINALSERGENKTVECEINHRVGDQRKTALLIN